MWWLAKQRCQCSPAKQKNLSAGNWRKGEYCVTNLLDNNPFSIFLVFLLYFDIYVQCLLSLKSIWHNVTSTFFVLSAYSYHSSVLKTFQCSIRKSACTIPGILRSLQIYSEKQMFLTANHMQTYHKAQGFSVDGQKSTQLALIYQTVHTPITNE